MQLLKRMYSYALRVSRGLFFRIMEQALPVRANRWCFVTWPGEYAHTLDNPRAVFEEIKNDPTIEKIILRRSGQVKESTVLEGNNVVAVEIESFRGAYLIATAGCLLTGFAVNGLCSYSAWLTSKHRIIQLWHGIPLKRIGRLFPAESLWENETYKYAATVCSAPEDASFMAQAFAPLDAARVWQTGLPRNSTILKSEGLLPADYRRDLERLRNILEGRRLVLYAPTWRDFSVGLYEFTPLEDIALLEVLERHNAVLGVRAHANRRTRHSGQSAARTVSMNDFPDVNLVLRETAVLLTDYSSIYIDFLLTGRPVVHFTYDLEAYVGERGFLYDLNDALAAAPCLTALAAVRDVDLALSGEYAHASQYERARMLFHKHRGAAAAADVTERIKGLMVTV